MLIQFTPNRSSFPQGLRAVAHDTGSPRRVTPDQRLIAARRKAKQDAERLGHQLHVFREDPVSTAYVTSTCDHYWAGVSIHVATGEISPSDLLQLTCRGRGMR